MAARNFTDHEEAQIAKIYLAGHSAKAIMRAYGLAHHISIMSALRRQGVCQRPPPERNRLYELDPTVFDEIDDEATAYWWGFLYADGCVYRRTLSLAITIRDVKHAKKLLPFMKSTSPVKHYKYTCSNGVTMDNCHVEFTDRHLATRMRELGIRVKRPSPLDALRHLPESLTKHWIRGYFDGDGSARKDHSIAFCGSEALLKWLRQVLSSSAGTNPNLAVSKHSTAQIYYLYMSGRLQALKVADYMYEDATIWLERKRQVIESWPEPMARQRDSKGRYT